jgi:two-component system chemotaxis sensor kinase CheA
LSDIRERLLGIFQVEHAEHLQKIRSILALHHQVGATAETDLDEAFRRAHSLKGAARAVDLPPVEALAHRLETLFSRVRQRTLPLDGRATQVIHQVLDSSEDCMTSLAENRTPTESSGALRAIEQLLDATPEIARGSSVQPPAPLRGSANDLPELTPESTRDAPAQAFRAIEMVRVRVEDLDRVVRCSGQLLTESLRQCLVTEQMSRMGREIAELEMEWSRFRQNSANFLRASSANRDAARAVRHLDAAEQKLQALARQSRTTALLQQRSAWASRNLSEQLQRDVWSARMVPAESFFEGFGRMVRDLARDEKKEIEFRVEGSDVRADRVVLQTLKDPVMHLLRNAISHGLEKPEERVSKGKPPAGSLALRIQCERRQLVIAVEDDGRGIDFERVGQVGVQRGLLSETQRRARAPLDLARIIFHPGFSTADTVTALSGRGMGLSVVLEASRSLQGDVELRTKTGPGTLFVVSVPLTVSSQRLLLVRCQGQTFGIPTHGVERLYRIKAAQLETVQGKPAASLDGAQFSLFSLEHLLGIGKLAIGEGAPGFDKDVLPVMLLKSGTKRAAILVDAFLNKREALVQDLGIPSGTSRMVTGAVLLEDGTAAMVLNPVHLIERCNDSEAPPWKTAAPATKKVSARILVVDDSITTRSLEKSILEAYGYLVRVAVDGLEALRLLREEKPDLVISDIQMPGMDGFELLETIKGDKALNHIPVIIVSSVERAVDQERGLALGAEAYIVKRSFDQRELLDTIQQVL